MNKVINIHSRRGKWHSEEIQSQENVVLATLPTGEKLLKTVDGLAVDIKGFIFLSNEITEEYQEIFEELKELIRRQRALVRSISEQAKDA